MDNIPLFFILHQQSPTQRIKKKKNRYKILCIKKLVEPIKPEKTAQIIIDHINLPDDQYRMGNTKVH